MDYLINYEPNLIILNFYYDEGQPYSCSSWGLEGNDKLPIIINDGAFNGGGGNDGFDKLFINDGVAPKHIFINKDLELKHKQSGLLSEVDAVGIILEMLDEIEGN